MEKVRLAGTDLDVSQICLGCWQFNDNKANVSWDAQCIETSKAIVDKCFDVGINFFDTAEAYSGSEQVLGCALRGRRQNAVVATKFGFREGPSTPPYSAVEIDEAVTRSLRNLETNYIDILQIHFPSFVKDPKETLDELNRQIAMGRIRYYGYSNFGPRNISSFKEVGFRPVVNQVCYNLLWRSVEYDVLPACAVDDINVLAYSPLQHGLLTGKFASLDDVPDGRRRGKLFATGAKNQRARHGQDGAESEVSEALQKLREICDDNQLEMSAAAIAWTLHQPPARVAIVGASSPSQVERNSKMVQLPDELVNLMSGTTEDVKKKIGKQLDQWASPDRCQ